MLIGPTRSYGSKAMSASNFAVQVTIGCCLFGWMPISDSAGCNPLFLKTGEGVYVERVYDKILDESRSPLAARLGAGVNEYFIANVEQTKSGDFHFSFNNFHDSTNGFRVNSCGELTETFGLRPREFRELGSLSFQFIVDGKEKTYRYVGNIDRHLMEKVLVGAYTDEAGKTYQFLSTGVAVFPDRSFSYRVDADLLMNNFDRFCETSSTGANIRCTGYKFNKTELHLYEDISFKSNGPSERSVFDVTRPHLVLKPKSN